MRLFNQISESYLEWEEYQQLIQEREEINFMHQTAIQSLKNKTTKEDEDEY